MTSKIIYHDFTHAETDSDASRAPALTRAYQIINAALNNLCLFLCGICCGISILVLLGLVTRA